MFTVTDLLEHLRENGVVLSRERVRQFRVGYSERKTRKLIRQEEVYIYENHYPPLLKRGVDWRYISRRVYITHEGMRKLCERYTVKLPPQLQDQHT